MQTFAPCSFLHYCPSFALQDQGSEGFVCYFLFKKAEIQVCTVSKQEFGCKKTHPGCYCIVEMLLCKQGEYSAPSSANTVLGAWFLFSARDASVRKNTLNIKKKINEIKIRTLNAPKKKKGGKGRVMVCHCFASQVLVYSCHSYLKCVYI